MGQKFRKSHTAAQRQPVFLSVECSKQAVCEDELMERMPEVRIDPDLALLVDARLVEGQTWSSLVREALTTYLAVPQTPQRRRARSGPVSRALATALKAVRFEDRDAAAIGLAKSLAARLDQHPSDAKYLSQRLLATLIELQLTPASVLGDETGKPELPHTTGGRTLARLRLQSAARQAGEGGIATFLALRDASDFGAEGIEEPARRYRNVKAPHVAAVAAALEALEA